MARGAVKELLSLLGLAIGFFVATWYYLDLAKILAGIIPDKDLAELLSYLVILLGGYFLGMFLSGMGNLFPAGPGNILNRILGAFIGLSKGALISMALFWLIKSYIKPLQDELVSSPVAQTLGKLITMLQGSSVL